MKNSPPAPSRLNIRLATEKDLPEIVRLLADDELGALREAYSLPLAQAYLDAFAVIDRDPCSELYVAELEERVVGTFQLNFLTYLGHQGRRVGQIEAVRIDKTLRGRKLGEAMMNFAITRARQQNCHRVQLTTNKIRKDAHRFYERLGFTPSHEGMKLHLDK
jgi:GNAT superfamily N-acetyltransferase